MNPRTDKEVERAIERWRRQYALILAEEAYKQYALAAVQADAQVRAPGVDRNPAQEWMVVSESAKAYARQYGEMLEREGASIINGQKVPWLKQLSEERRRQIAEIIEEGIAQGRHPGARETAKGTYPRDSTAARLQEFFHDRKSHASTVARTETASIRGNAKADRWLDRGYSVVKIFDGRGNNPCDICRSLDGQYWTTAYYKAHVLEHPNCTRTASPVRVESIPEGTTIVGA